MKTRALLPPVLALVVVALLAGCSAIRVTTDWDREVDFAGYKTYRWAPTQKTEDYRAGDQSLLDKRIRSAVANELKARGLKQRDGGGADLLAVYRVSSHRRTDVYRHSTYRRPYGRVVDVHQYREGTLLLMFVDPKLDQVVWEGAAVGALDGSDRPEQIAKAVARVLQDFPPQ